MWKFSFIPDGWWDDPSHQRHFLQTLAATLFPDAKAEHMKENCYKLTSSMLHGHNGGGLIHKFNGSVISLVRSAFPDHKWLPWKFVQLPKDFWTNRQNVAEYMEWLAKKLDIQSMDQWYNVKKTTFDQNFGTLALNTAPASLNCEISRFIYASYL